MEDNTQWIAADLPDASNWQQREGDFSLWDALDFAFTENYSTDMLNSLFNFFICLDSDTEMYPPDMLKSLISSFNRLDVEGQTTALRTLGEMGRRLPDGLRRGVISYFLAKHLDDSHIEVRVTAIQAIGTLTRQTFAEALALKLVCDESTRVKIASAEALGELTASLTLHAFKESLSDPSWKVRAAAIQSLGKLSERLILEPLQTALDDQDFSVRSAALHTLGTFKGCLSTEYLVSLAQEETNDWITRDAAVTALERAGEHVQAKPLREMLDHALETESSMAEDEKGEPPEAKKGLKPLFLKRYKDARSTNRPSHLPRLREKVALVSNNLRKWREKASSYNKVARAMLLLLTLIIGGSAISIVSKHLKKYGAPVFSHTKGALVILVSLIIITIGVTRGGSSLLYSDAKGNTTPSNNAHLEPMNQPRSVVTGQTFSIRITATNDGSTTWTETGDYQLACHIENTQGVGCMGANEITISHSVSHDGGTYTFVIQLTAPPTTATYTLQWTMSQDGIRFGNSLYMEVLVT